MQNATDRNIIGPDLNEYRGEVDYALLATQTPYAYLRGSGYGTGRFRIDRMFIEYVRGLRNVGVKTGAYHYAVPSTDLSTADAQCDNFIDILQQAYGPGRYGDLFPVIDIEAPLDKSISTDALLDWVDRFRKRFERRTRRKMMLYTGAFFIELYNNFYHTKKGFILADMPLWIAMYPEIQPNPEYPRDQGGWTRWRMWQFTENGSIPGVSPPVDLNYGPESLELLMQPRVVQNFRAVPIGQEIRMTWTPNTDIDLGGYNIFINANYVTTVGRDANSYILQLANRPSPGEKFIMSIEAFDTDGDFSQERATANVTFGRGMSVNDEELENYQLDNRWNDDSEVEVEIQPQFEVEIQPKIKPVEFNDPIKFNDPVDNLARRFIKPVEKNKSVNVNLYDDFVETDNEFDDILYMKRLEAEVAYKKYYGDRENKDRLGLYEIEEDFRCENHDKKMKENDTCPKCIKHHEEHKEHHKGDYQDYEDCDHQQLEVNKCSCGKHDKDKDDYHDECNWDTEGYHHEDDKDDCNYYEHKENEHYMKEEFNKFPYENQHKENEHHKDKDDVQNMELEINKYPCKENDKDYDDHEDNYKEHHHCDDHDKKKYYDEQDCMKEWNSKPSIKCKCGEEEENQNLPLSKENSEGFKRYEYKPSYDEILRERYEGDRRRLENRAPNKYYMCEECVQPKSNCAKCEYLIQDMYLNNCDYGHKHHKKKHHDKKDYDECYPSKKKKKKHHKKHHR